MVLQPPVDDFVEFGAGVDALKAVERLTWRERREREREPEMNHNAPQHMNLVPRRAVNNSLRSIIANSLVTDAEKRSGARDAAAAADAKQRKSDQKARVALGVERWKVPGVEGPAQGSKSVDGGQFPLLLSWEGLRVMRAPSASPGSVSLLLRRIP